MLSLPLVNMCTNVSIMSQNVSSQQGTIHSMSESRSNSIVAESARRGSTSYYPPPSASSRPGSSLSRISLDQAGGARQRLPGERIVISDWRPPVSSVMASQLMEIDQRSALQNYVAALEDELKKHNESRSLMAKAFNPRSPNSTKAMNNWNRKCHYLHTEIFKFKTYVESLDNASKAKEKVYKEREEREQAKAAEKPENST